jgi:hypothetical protein
MARRRWRGGGGGTGTAVLGETVIRARGAAAYGERERKRIATKELYEDSDPLVVH